MVGEVDVTPRRRRHVVLAGELRDQGLAELAGGADHHHLHRRVRSFTAARVSRSISRRRSVSRLS